MLCCCSESELYSSSTAVRWCIRMASDIHWLNVKLLDCLPEPCDISYGIFKAQSCYCFIVYVTGGQDVWQYVQVNCEQRNIGCEYVMLNNSHLILNKCSLISIFS